MIPDQAPHLSEVVKNWTEVAAIVAAGGWALWRFGYVARADTPSLDGELSIAQHAAGNGLLVVSVRALWNNRSRFTLALDPRACSVSVYEIPDQLRVGPLDPSKDLAEPLHVQVPFAEQRRLDLEPKTASALQAHFVLRGGPLYLFRWELATAEPYDGAPFHWRRDALWNSAPDAPPHRPDSADCPAVG